MTTREAYWRAVYDKRNFLTDQGTQNWVLGPSRKSLPTNVPDEPKLINVNSLRPLSLETSPGVALAGAAYTAQCLVGNWLEDRKWPSPEAESYRISKRHPGYVSDYMNATKPALQSHLQTTMRLWPSGGTTTALSATTGSTTGGSGGAATWQLDSPAKRSPYGNTYNSQQRGAAVPKPYESVTDTTVNKSERLEFQAPQATDPKALLTKPLPSSADITASQLNMSVVRDGTVSQAYAGRWRSMYNAQYCRQPWHSCKA